MVEGSELARMPRYCDTNEVLWLNFLWNERRDGLASCLRWYNTEAAGLETRTLRLTDAGGNLVQDFAEIMRRVLDYLGHRIRIQFYQIFVWQGSMKLCWHLDYMSSLQEITFLKESWINTSIFVSFPVPSIGD